MTSAVGQGAALTTRLTRLWHIGRRPLTTRRLPYMAFNRMRPSRSQLLVRADSSLLIEGPMRSGNTYAVAAFRLANGPDHHIGRHLHAPAHVLQAVHLGIPALVLLRDPIDACVSHVIRRPALRLEDSLIDYADFYRALEDVRETTVVAPFAVLIDDYGRVLTAVNERFGTTFLPYVKTPENEQLVQRMVEEMHMAERHSAGAIDEMRVPRPSERRRGIREALVHSLEHPRMRPLVEDVRSLHDSWMRGRATVRSRRGET